MTRFNGNFLNIFLALLVTSLFIQTGSCLSYGPPTPDPLYKTQYELEKEVVKDEIYVSKVILGNLFDFNKYKYVIRNSSSEPFYTLVELENGFNWKEIAMQGYLFEVWLKPQERLYFWPSSGGWTKSEYYEDKKVEKVVNHGTYILRRSYIKGGWPQEATGETVITYNIPVLKDAKIQEVVLKHKVYMEDGDAVDEFNFWFDKNPIDTLKIVNPSNNPKEDWYFQISEKDHEGVIFLSKYQKDKEVFKDIPKEYYPGSRLMNNTRSFYSCGSYPDCGTPPMALTVIPFTRESFKVDIPDSPSMPDELEIPEPEKIEMPCLYKGKICSIKGTRHWMLNDEFVPLEIEDRPLKVCTSFSCISIYEEDNEANGLSLINRSRLESLLKGIILYLPIFFNMLLFFGLQYKKKIALGYFKAFESALLFSVVDFYLIHSVTEHISVSYWLLYPAGVVLITAFCWAILKIVLFQFLRKKLLLGKVKLFWITFGGCLITACFFFWGLIPFINNSP